MASYFDQFDEAPAEAAPVAAAPNAFDQFDDPVEPVSALAAPAPVSALERTRQHMDSALAQTGASDALGQIVPSPAGMGLPEHKPAETSLLEDIAAPVKRGARALAAGVPGFTGGGYGALAVPFEALGEAEKLALGTETRHPFEDIGVKLRGVAKGQEQLATKVAGDQKGAGLIEKSIYSGLQSLGQNAVPLLAGVATGGAGLALGAMSTAVGGTEYAKAREKGASVAKAIPYAANQAIIEYGTEKIPVAWFLKDLAGNTGFVKTLVHNLAAEIPGEQVATVLQDLNEWATLRPEAPFSQYLAERPSAAAQTLIATMVASGAQVSAGHGVKLAVKKAQGKPAADSPEIAPKPAEPPASGDAEAMKAQVNPEAGSAVVPPEGETPATDGTAAEPAKSTPHPELTALQAVRDKAATPEQMASLEEQKLIIRNEAGQPRLLPAGRRRLTELKNSPAEAPEAPPVKPQESPATPSEPKAPPTPAERVKTDEGLRAGLTAMKAETGWAETGGKVIRDADTEQVTGRTKWIPREDWWQERPKGLTEEQVHKAVDKHLAGETLNGREQKIVAFMTDVHDERQARDKTAQELEQAIPDLAQQAPEAKDLTVLASRAGEVNQTEAQRIIDTWEDDSPETLTRVQGELERIISHGRQTERSGQAEPEADEGTSGQGVAGQPAPAARQFTQALETARADTRVEPTAAQKKSGRYPKGKLDFAGLSIRIENPAGSTRTKHNDAGEVEWSRKMQADYGFIERTKGNDGDAVDVFLTGRPDTGKVFVVNQVHADGRFDEHKGVLGAETREEAEKLYRSHYPKDWKGLGSLTEMSTDQFKEWAKSGDKRRPVDRRADSAQRKKVSEMGEGELRKALLSHELTGIPNRRAYEDADKLPVQVSVDVDSLKWVNDSMGHEQGNELLKAVAQKLSEETPHAYHISGDEFVVQAKSEAEAQAIMARVAAKLKTAKVEVLMPDGHINAVNGLGVSYGLADTLEAADAKLQTHKTEREAQGLRAGRGQSPPGASRRPAGPRREDQAGDVSQAEVGEKPKFSRGKLPREVLLRKGVSGDGVNYTIMKDGKDVGRIAGPEEGRRRFHMFLTGLRPGSLTQGTGLYQRAVQEAADHYREGLYVYEWEASVALKKALAKMSTFERVNDRLVIHPSADVSEQVGAPDRATTAGLQLPRVVQNNKSASESESTPEKPKYARREELEAQIQAALDEKRTTSIQLGHTPNTLIQLGIPDLPLRLTSRVAQKMFFDHGLTRAQISQIPQMLADPLMVFNSDTVPDGIVVLTKEEVNGDPLVVTIFPNGEIERTRSNVVTSAYGKQYSKAIGKWIEQGLLRGAQKKSALGWLTTREPWSSQRRLLPPVVQAIAKSAEIRVAPPSPTGKPSASSRSQNGQGLPRERVQAIVAKVLAKHAFAKLPPIHVVPTLADLPAELQRQMGGIEKDTATGAVFWPQKSEVYLVASHTGSEAEAIENLYHELVGHYGLRQLMDATNRNVVLDGILRDLPAYVAAAAERNGIKMDTLESRRNAAEEVIAYAAGQHMSGQPVEKPLQPWLDRVLTLVRNYFRRLMDKAVFDDKAILDIIQQSQRALEQPGEQAPTTNSAALRSQRALTYFSAAARAVAALKQPRASAQQWLATISKTPGVKPEELEFLGLADWLNAHDGPITQQEVLDYIRANTLEVRDVLLGDKDGSETPEGRRVTQLAEQLRAKGYGVIFDDAGKLSALNKADGDELGTFHVTDTDFLQKLAQADRPLAEELLNLSHAPQGWGMTEADTTRYGEYALPGGENYRELLLTLPNSFTSHELAQRKEVFGRYKAQLDALYKVAQNYDEAVDVRKKALSEWEALSAERDAEANKLAPVRAPYKSSHFNEHNIVAHVRFDTRVDSEGKRTLHIAEVQSDMHQQGRKHGYLKSGDVGGAERAKQARLLARDAYLSAADADRSVPRDLPGSSLLQYAERGVYEGNAQTQLAGEAYRTANDEFQRTEKDALKVPDAPFKTSWPELAMKRMIRMAAEMGVDRVSWDTGSTQNERYNLEHLVHVISYIKKDDGEYEIGYEGAAGAEGIISHGAKPEELAGMVGEEVAQKMLRGEGKRRGAGDRVIRDLTGLDLRTGGEGQRGFYDGILPRTVGKLIKRWGGKVGTTRVETATQQEHDEDVELLRKLESLPEKTTRFTTVHSFDLTPEMVRAALAEGFPLYSRRKAADGSVSTDNAYSRRAQKLIDLWNEKVGWRFGALGKLPMKTQYLERRYLALGEVQRAKDIGHSVYQALSRATPEDQKEVYGYLTHKDADPNAIGNPAIRADAVNAKHQIDLAGQALVDAGLMSQETYEAHAGEYLPRLYLKHLLGKEGNRMMGSGKTLSDMGYLKKRKDIDEETRKVILGEITDPGFLASFGLTRTLRDIALVDFLETVSHNTAWVPPEATVEWRGRKVSPFFLRAEARLLRDRMVHYQAPEKAKAQVLADQMDEIATKALEALEVIDRDLHKQVPDSGRYGALRGLWVRKEVFEDLVGSQQMMPADASNAEKIFGDGGFLAKTTSWWKMSKVALNPPSQVRNFIGNNVLLHLSGVPLRRVYSGEIQLRAINSIRKKDRYYEIAKKYGLFAVTFANNELARIQTEWLTLQAKNTGALSFARMKAMGGAVMNFASDSYAMMEAISKISKVIDAMEREGKGEAQAMTEAHEALFDYSLVPRSVRYARNTPLGVPFLTFAWKVLPRLAEVAIKYPWRYAPYVALSYGITAVFKSLFDVDDDDLEHLKKAMPAWIQEKGQPLILPWKDSKGRWQAMDLGYLTPWGMYADILASAQAGKLSAIPGIVGVAGGPVPDLVSAINTGIDGFTGQEIMRHEDPPADQAQQLVSYLWSMAAPGWITEKGWMGKAYKAHKGKVDPRTGEPLLTPTQAHLGLAGLNLYPFDPQESQQKNLMFMQFDIKDIQRRMKSVLRDKNLDQEERKERRKVYVDLIHKKIAEMRQYKRDSTVPAKLRTSQPEADDTQDDEESPTASLQQLQDILTGKPRREVVSTLRDFGYPATAELIASLPPIPDRDARTFFTSQTAEA